MFHASRRIVSTTYVSRGEYVSTNIRVLRINFSKGVLTKVYTLDVSRDLPGDLPGDYRRVVSRGLPEGRYGVVTRVVTRGSYSGITGG